MRNPKLSYIMVYISEIIIGILLLIFTQLVFNYMAVLIGSVVILFGIIKAALSIKLQQTEQKTLGNQMELILGVLLIFVGIFILVKRENVSSVMPILFGAYIILGGLLDLRSIVAVKKIQMSKWWIFLITFAIAISGGALVIVSPWNRLINNQIIGVLLLIKAINDIVMLFLLYIGNKEDIKYIEGKPDIQVIVENPEPAVSQDNEVQ